MTDRSVSLWLTMRYACGPEWHLPARKIDQRPRFTADSLPPQCLLHGWPEPGAAPQVIYLF